MTLFVKNTAHQMRWLLLIFLIFVASACVSPTVPVPLTDTPESPAVPDPTDTPTTVAPEATRPPATVEPITAVVTAQALNVRTGPDVAYPRVDVVVEGTTLVLDGRNASGTWIRVGDRDEDVAGWLSAEFTEIRGDVMALPVIDVEPPPTPEPSPTRPPATPTPESIAVTPEAVGARGGYCPGNRLVNGAFEEGFSERGRGEISVATGWHPWFKNSPGTGGINYIPEYKPEDAQVYGMRRVHSGRFAQKWFTTFATHTAGILQQVSGVPVGRRLLLTAWVQVWSDDTDDPATSDVPGNYRVSVGIDPYGGTDYNSDNVVWSEFNTFAYDAYKQLSVAAIAQNNVVTVFLSGVPEFPVKHNDSYWDDACLTIESP